MPFIHYCRVDANTSSFFILRANESSSDHPYRVGAMIGHQIYWLPRWAILAIPSVAWQSRACMPSGHKRATKKSTLTRALTSHASARKRKKKFEGEGSQRAYRQHTTGVCNTAARMLSYLYVYCNIMFALVYTYCQKAELVLRILVWML